MFNLFKKKEEENVIFDKRDLSKNAVYFAASGSGYVDYIELPEIKQAVEEGSSFVVTDFKGYILENYKNKLIEAGYKIKVLNLENPKESTHYNPFHYIKCQMDTAKVGAALCPFVYDMFFTSPEKTFTIAMVAYMFETFADRNEFLEDGSPNPYWEERKNLSGLLALLRKADVCDEDGFTKLDNLFAELAEKNPNSFAAKLYHNFKVTSEKSKMDAFIHTLVKLEHLEYDAFRNDELELDKVSKEKTALFIVLDNNEGHLTDTMAIAMVTQLLDILFMQGEVNIGREDRFRPYLDIPVRFFFNEDLRILQHLPSAATYTSGGLKYGVSFTTRFYEPSHVSYSPNKGYDIDSLLQNNEEAAQRYNKEKRYVKEEHDLSAFLNSSDRIGIVGGVYDAAKYNQFFARFGIKNGIDDLWHGEQIVFDHGKLPVFVNKNGRVLTLQ